MYAPKVSIIIPIYNGSNYMREAIDSALSQTYKNIEIIVVNDGSNDGGRTDEIARSYGEQIRYFTKENGGVSSALNLGVREMSGEFISWLSHDDVYENDKVEKQVAVLNRFGKADSTVVCCNYMQIDEQSKPLGMIGTIRFKPGQVYTSEQVLTELLLKATFNGCCLLIPKKAIVDCGMFDEKLRFCQDAVMWYKLFARGYVLVCNEEVSVKSRVHANQLTQTGQKLFRKECNAISNMLSSEFARISTKERNYLKMYLLSDARYFSFESMTRIVAFGKEKKLISALTVVKAYCVCCYGVIRPTIRKIYYTVCRRMRTN